MSVSPEDREIVETINDRIGVLRELAESPQTKQDMVEHMNCSRSTIDRRVRSLVDCNCANRQPDGKYGLTVKGVLLTRIHLDYLDWVSRIDNATRTLSHVPIDLITNEFLRNMEIYTGDSYVPEAALGPLSKILERAVNIVWLVGSASTYCLNLLLEQDEKRRVPIEIVGNFELILSLLKVAEDELRSIFVSDNSNILATNYSLPFSAWLVSTQQKTFSGITVHDEGAFRGLLLNDTCRSFNWLKEIYSVCKNNAIQF